MSNRFNIKKSASSLDYDYPKGEYTKVRIVFDERADPVEVGTDDGLVLEIKNPWAESFAEQMATDILGRIKGYYYQPFEAKGAHLPDIAELGDSVIVNGVHAPIISQDIDFNSLCTSDISAPNGNEKDNEFGDYVASQDDPISRELGRIRTELIVNYDSISASVTDLTNNMGQTLRIAADGVTITNAQGSALEIDGGQLKANSVTADEINSTNLHVSAANIDGTLTASQINTNSITVGSLKDGSSYATKAYVTQNAGLDEDEVDSHIATYIDGTSITAEQLRGGSIELLESATDTAGWIYLEGSNANPLVRKVTIESAAVTISSTSGAISIEPNDYVYIGAETQIAGNTLPTSDGVYSCGTYGFKWSQVYASTGTISTSDAKEKNSIEELPLVYEEMFNQLTPVRYKFNDGTSDRYHVGFIAQDVERAIEIAGLTTKDFAGFVRDKNADGNDGLGLRYGEFIALNTHMIKNLQKRVDALEAKYGN